MRWLSLLFPLFLAIGSSAQVDRAAFLALAEARRLPDSTDAATASPRFSPVRSYELRTETDRFDPARQEYNLRFNLTGRRVRQAQRALAALYAELPYSGRDERRYRVRGEALADWQQLHQHRRTLSYLDSLVPVLDDRVRVRERQLAAGRGAAADLLDARATRATLALRRERERAAFVALADLYDLDPARLVFAAPPSLDSLVALVKTAPPVDYEPRAAEYALEQRLNEGERRLERAEARQRLDFVQLGYNGPHADPWRERISLQAAILLDTDGNKRLKLAELTAEQRERDYTRAERRARRAAAAERLASSIVLGAVEYRAEAASFAALRADQLRYLAVERARGPAPLLALRIAEARLRFELAQLERYFAIYTDYTAWRSLRGELP